MPATFDNHHPAEPPIGSVNRDGEVERVLDTEVTHRFVDAGGPVYHLVTAGDAAGPTVVVVHGMPESWFAWHHQIDALAHAGYGVVAPDMLGYGQSDKRLELDFTPPGMARQLVAVLDQLGVEHFHVLASDRGSVLADNLFGVEEVGARIISYIRAQQSGNRPHSEPRPPHEIFASDKGVKWFSHPEWIPRSLSSYLVATPVDADVIERMRVEWAYPGIPQAVSRYFQTTNFDIELESRLGGLFEKMCAPVLFLQGTLDPGQQPHEYETITDAVAAGELQFIESGHFMHLEDPDLVNVAVLEWLRRHSS